MSEWIIYVFESGVLLALFYLVYVVVLRKETFFQLNRLYLLAIPVFALLFPLVQLDFTSAKATVAERPVEEISRFRKSYYDAIADWEFENRAQPSSIRWKHDDASPLPWITRINIALVIVYLTGLLICLSRTVWSIRWITNLITRYPRENRAGTTIIRIPYPTAPFSFMNYVFVHAPLAESQDLDQILEHERTHIREKHSVDLLFLQLVAALIWFNPIIWRLIKSLKTTHEYIADQRIINSGYSIVEYQTLLLRQLISNNSYGLVHNFNLSFIKKRITMMKNKKSGWPGKLKVAATITMLIICSAVIFQCNSKIDEQLSVQTSASSISSTVKLPALPPNGFRLDSKSGVPIQFHIAGDQLRVDGEVVSIEGIAGLLDGGDHGRMLPVMMMIDEDQKMGFVRKVHMALRKADRRKLLYLGQTLSGEEVHLMLTLPPDPETADLPDAEKLHTEGKLDLLKIDLGKPDGPTNQQKVYDFVRAHIAKNSSDYVVSAKMSDQDKYGDYLLNYFHVREGFNKIYQERAMNMFGKDFYQTTQEEYQAVRENIPMSISIAED